MEFGGIDFPIDVNKTVSEADHLDQGTGESGIKSPRSERTLKVAA